MQTAMITRRLNAAEPTIVNGPSAGAKNWFLSSSMMDSMISGADEPSAISVKFATVEFQTFFLILCLTPPWTFTQTFRSALHISSIAPMKPSHTIAMPMKHHPMPMRYKKARRNLFHVCSISPPIGISHVPSLHGSHTSGFSNRAMANSSSVGQSGSSWVILARTVMRRIEPNPRTVRNATTRAFRNSVLSLTSTFSSVSSSGGPVTGVAASAVPLSPSISATV
mmetsp:Transcript_26312/g.60718  ORF Transcript_26312/g.60718 Transcript_26312/m.60718 type:complete len:224 (+) Transcript_26312:2179-2850(+)